MENVKIETNKEGDIDIMRFALCQIAAMELFERVEKTLLDSFKEKLESDLEANLKDGNRKQRKEAEEALALHIQRCKSSFKSYKKNNEVLVESIATFASAEKLKSIATEIVKKIDKAITEE